MYLTKEEERILDGEMGEARQLAMEVVVKVGEVMNAEKLIPVKSAHISGVSYKNIGDEGLEFLHELRDKGGMFTVKTTLNPSGIDLDKWSRMNSDEKFARKQVEIISVFREMGAIPILTCTPYFYVDISAGDHLAWAESNAVLYANSVIGAFTNREGGPLAVFEAIVGKAPYVGLHLKRNRFPSIIFDLKNVRDYVKERGLYANLGYYIGYVAKKGIPLIRNIPERLREKDTLKLFLAAIGASSGIGMVILENISPEYLNIRREDLSCLETLAPDVKEIIDTSEKIQKSNLEDVDAILLGCPHLSLNDIRRIAMFFKYRKPKKRVILFTARQLKRLAKKYIELLEKNNVEVYYDTCMVVADLRRMNVTSCIVDSAKAAYYLTAQGYDVKILGLDEVLRVATE